MASDEIFLNPTVKQVIFEARYPSLFYLEGKIGEIQLALMKEFPKAQLLHRQQILVADLGPDDKLGEQGKVVPADKVWRFQSGDGDLTVNFQTSRFDVTSKVHKTYSHATSERKFRDVLEFVVGAFLKAAVLPTFSRLGLRYVDDCPLPCKTTAAFREHYASAYPSDRFSLESTRAFDFATIVEREGVCIRYSESLSAVNGKPKYVLDFDGFAENVPAGDWLQTADRLHEVISDEFFATIKEPVKDIMRRTPEA